MAKATAVHSPALLAALERATGVLPNSIRRIVIDIKAGEFPLVYIEQFGDPDKLVDVVEAMTEIRIQSWTDTLNRANDRTERS